MMLEWFNAREAAEVGTALADEFAPQTAPWPTAAMERCKAPLTDALQELLRRADSEVRQLRLNFYKKARFANSFKWRLIENGVEPDEADEVTQSLIVHLSQKRPTLHGGAGTRGHPAPTRESVNDALLLAPRMPSRKAIMGQAVGPF